MIVGGPGSGKSTLARRLGTITGLPVCHLDLIHHKPGWVARPMVEKLPLVAAWESQGRWIIEGGLTRTYPNRMARADTIVFLDLPVWRRLCRVVRRRITYCGGKTRPDLPENCPENLNWEFAHFILTTARRGRARNLSLRDDAPHAHFVRLTSDRRSAQWLADIAAGRGAV